MGRGVILQKLVFKNTVINVRLLITVCYQCYYDNSKIALLKQCYLMFVLSVRCCMHPFLPSFVLHMSVLTRFSCVRLFVTPWTVTHQAPWDSPGKITMASSRESSRSRAQTRVSYISCIDRQLLFYWRHLVAILYVYVQHTRKKNDTAESLMKMMTAVMLTSIITATHTSGITPPRVERPSSITLFWAPEYLSFLKPSFTIWEINRPASQLFPEDRMTWCKVQKAYVYDRGQFKGELLSQSE